jgi:DNA repair protein RadC
VKEGLDNFEEHEVLEYLLFHCVPRINTNGLAHLLLEEFGSLHQVLDATPQDLQRVKGVGERVATSLSFFSSFCRYYYVNKAENEMKELKDPYQCIEYLKPYFLGQRNEVVYILCLDAKCRVLLCKKVGEGSVNSAGVPIRRIVEIALAANATTIILAHNHPSGIAVPSGEDVQTTRLVAKALKTVDVILADHIVFSNTAYTSMYQTDYYKPSDIYPL